MAFKVFKLFPKQMLAFLQKGKKGNEKFLQIPNGNTGKVKTSPRTDSVLPYCHDLFGSKPICLS